MIEDKSKVGSRIETIILKITDVCNLNCKMCGQNNRNTTREGNFINVDDLKYFLEHVPPGKLVFVWGGEPLLHPKFTEIINFLRDKGLIISIVSNGYFLDKYIDFFIDINLPYLTISIDGQENIHDEIRGKKGVYKKAISSIEKYIEVANERDVKIDITINYTILPENYRNMLEFSLEAKKIGINRIVFNLPRIVDRKLGELLCKNVEQIFGREFNSWKGFVSEGMDINIYELERICTLLKSQFEKYPGFISWAHESFIYNEKNLSRYFNEQNKFIINNYEYYHCKRVMETLGIDTNGNIVVCPDFPETVIGNIKVNDYSEFENSDLYKSLFATTKFFASCVRCSHRYKGSPDEFSEIGG